MNRLAQHAMTAERQTTQNETTAANEGDAATPGQSGVAALDRAFSILFAFRPGDYALTLAELAARTGLYKSTILRLAGSLIQHRMLFRLEDGRYQIGAAPLMLGALRHLCAPCHYLFHRGHRAIPYQLVANLRFQAPKSKGTRRAQLSVLDS